MFKKAVIDILIVFYFVNLLFYSICSFFGFEELETFFWFNRVPILIILYLISASKKEYLYIMGLLLYQIASMLFAVETKTSFFYGAFCSVLFKFCLLLLVLRFVNRNNYKAIGIAFIPFFIIYLYLIQIIMNALGNSLYLWLFNALLTSFIGGIAIINYLNESNKRNYWLLISSILFIIQIGAYFINRFYLKEEAIHQLVIFSYGLSHFSFYKFLIINQEEQHKI